MLRVLTERAGNMQEQMVHLSRKKEILRKNQKKILEKQQDCNINEHAFDRLTSGLYTAQETAN